MLQNSRPDTLGVWLLCALLAAASTAAAQQPQQDPIGRYVTLTSPVDDVVIGAVQRAAMALHSEAVREQRPAFLILEVAPGQSQFHHIYALATFLTSADLGNVTTVAWVPETVTGHNAIIPLVCHEVVMSPEARLGDFGLGTALPPDQQAVVQQIVARQRNRKINFALARAMMDPSVQLLQLTIERDGDRERRLVTAQEAEEIQNSPATVTDSRVLKEPGVPGLFSGEQAARGDFLVRQAIEQLQRQGRPPSP